MINIGETYTLVDRNLRIFCYTLNDMVNKVIIIFLSVFLRLYSTKIFTDKKEKEINKYKLYYGMREVTQGRLCTNTRLYYLLIYLFIYCMNYNFFLLLNYNIM